MAKIPYLFRRNNTFYFRSRIPLEYQASIKAKEITRSLRTENQAEAIPLALKFAANFKATLQDIQSGKIHITSYSQLVSSLDVVTAFNAAQNDDIAPLQAVIVAKPTIPYSTLPQVPLLSFVIDDFLSRYDVNNKAMLTKLTSFMPIFLGLIEDGPVDEILQGDLNRFFDDIQKLPARRTAKKFNKMTFRQMIAANDADCISKKTFEDSYRSCVSSFLVWAKVNYKDQGFPDFSTASAKYRGVRTGSDNKQRAIREEELRILFNHKKMQSYAANSEKAHCYWLPIIGLHTGARINEICQLNPAEDILQDHQTGLWYLWFNEETESSAGVDKSIKSGSSKRIVPIHSKLLELGFLDYVMRIKREGHKTIFPQWTPRNGKASANACKWFSRYLADTGLRDETLGAKLVGMHSFRHTFVTHGLNNKISGVFSLTGHETESIDGFGKITKVAAGYWTKDKTDNIQDLKEVIEKFDFGIEFYKPS